MIKVEHLVKKYGDRYAVNDISFEVRKGEIVGFLGPNGAGKSTTLNILTGYLSSTSGKAMVDGLDILVDQSSTESVLLLLVIHIRILAENYVEKPIHHFSFLLKY